MNPALMTAQAVIGAGTDTAKRVTTEAAQEPGTTEDDGHHGGR
jgi:hypothetical protein